MSSANLMRGSALACMLSGVLIFMFFLVNPARNPAGLTSSPYVTVHLLGFAAAVLGQLGLVGLYLRQRKQAGILGAIGFVVSFIGLALVAGEVFFDTYIFPILMAEVPDLLTGPLGVGPVTLIFQLTSAFFVLGFILFGIATLRAGILPRWGALLVTVGSLYGVGRLPIPDLVRTLGAAAFGLGLAWLGYALWSGAREMVD